MQISFQPPNKLIQRRASMPLAQQRPQSAVRFGVLEDLVDKDAQGTVELGGNLQNLTSSIYRTGGHFHSIKARQDVRLKESTVDQVVSADENVRIAHCPKIARVHAGENVKLWFAPSVAEVHAKGHVDVDYSVVEGDLTTFGFAKIADSTIRGKVLSGSLKSKNSHFGLVHSRHNADLKQTTVPGLVEVRENLLAIDCPELGNLKVGETLRLLACPKVGQVTTRDAKVELSTLASLTTTEGAQVKESRISDKVVVQGGNMELRGCPELGEVYSNASYNYIGNCPSVSRVETTGYLQMEDATVTGDVISQGDTQLTGSRVKGRLSVKSNNLVLNQGTTVEDVFVAPAFLLPDLGDPKQPLSVPTAQVVRIAGNSIVKGDIHFKFGNGVVLLQKGSRIEGHVFGGTIQEVDRL